MQWKFIYIYSAIFIYACSVLISHTQIICGYDSFFFIYLGQITSDETLKYHLHCLSEEILQRLVDERFRHRRIAKFIRIQYTYSHKNSSKQSSQNGSSIFPTVEDQTASQLCDRALEAIFKDITCEINTINITRLCYTIRGFVNVC